MARKKKEPDVLDQLIDGFKPYWFALGIDSEQPVVFQNPAKMSSSEFQSEFTT